MAAALLFFAFPASASGANQFVDDDASSNLPPCTVTQPCQDIFVAVNAAAAGDAVVVDGGTYNESVLLNDGKSLVTQEFRGDVEPETLLDGGAGNAIQVPPAGAAGTIRGFTIAADTDVVQLNGRATIRDNRFVDLDASDGTYVLLQPGAGASSVQNNVFTDTSGGADDQRGVSVVLPGSPTIAGNRFENLQQGVAVSGGGSPTVFGNTMTGTRQGGNAGTAMSVVFDATPTIVDNTISAPEPGDVTIGIQIVEGNPPAPTGAILRRNEVFDHMTNVDVRDTSGSVTLDGDVLAGGSTGLFAIDDPGNGTGSGEGDVTATNVTVFGNDLFPNAAHLTLDSSIVGNQIGPVNGATCAITFSRGPVTGSGCDNFQTTAAPQFVNPAANNYHLRAGSPMIDQGNPAAATGSDLDGNPRAMDGNTDCIVRRDIGADEFVPPAPVATITSGPAVGSMIADPTPTFGFTSTGPAGCTLRECRIDGGTFVACSSPRTLAPLADGAHAFRVRGRHVGGQTGAPARRSFTVDTVPPETDVTKRPKKRVKTRKRNKNAKFKFESDEPGSSFECRLQSKKGKARTSGDDFEPCESPFRRKVKADRKHELEVRATDQAGNIDPTPATHRWKVKRKRRS
ncbi:MAG: right-handed parallel beta-helix repeat-containing protein [Gaiellaceae bacterium]